MDKVTSEVTEDCDSMHLPRMGDRPPRGLPSPCPASWGSGAPGGLRGRELAMPVAPPGPSSSTTDLPMPCPLPPCDRQAAPLEEGTCLALSQHPAPPLPPMFWALPAEWSRLAWSYRSRLCDPPIPTEGAARHSCCESTSCVCLSTLFRRHRQRPAFPPQHPPGKPPWLCVCW